MSNDEKIIPFPEGNRNEALRRIREAAEDGRLVLDLGDLALDSLPKELGELTGLRHLVLGRGQPLLDDEGQVTWWIRLNRQKGTFTDLRPLAGLTNLQSLDLSDATRLRDLSPLSALSNLQRLNLRGCISVADLTPLANLRELAVLCLDSLPISDMTPLRNLVHLDHLDLKDCESVFDLAPLAELKRLTSLILHKTSILDIRPLASLTCLTNLDMSCCRYVFKTGPLASLVHLTKLRLANNEQLDAFSFLAELHELERLNLFGCHLLSDLKPLVSLTRLTHLDISYCPQVRNIEPLAGLSNLFELNVEGCTGIESFAPLDGLTRLQVFSGRGTTLDVPEYLLASGDAQSILAWLRGTVVGIGPPLAEIKLLLLGQGRVGKSHLRRRMTGEYGPDYHDGRLEPTQNIDCADCTAELSQHHPIRQSYLRIRVWDFGGQNHLHSAHRFFLGCERCFYVLVLAADRPANGEGAESNRLNYWLRLIAWYGRTSREKLAPVVIVITRSDEPTAATHRQPLEDALRAAERHDWFGAKVVRVIRGMGWSQTLDSERDNAIWNRHMTAYHEVLSAIDKHLDQVPVLNMPVPMACHKAIKFVEAAFDNHDSPDRPDRRPYLLADDLNAVDELRDVPAGALAEDQRRGLRHAVLGLLNSLGAIHWLGGAPEVVRRNPWGIRDWVFNPEWVKRPVYDLLWRAAPREAQVGFLTDRHVQEVLPTRPSGNPDGADLYEKTAFTDEDRGRVLELMKTCRLIFDSPQEPGILVPDLLETARLPDDEVVREGWRYSAEFLPEKVLLRFIAQQYRAIDTRSGHCFRNRVVWRRGEQEVVLETHFSPPGGTRPYVLIRPASAHGTVPESIAASVGLLLDEIFVDEGLGEVRRDLRPAGESRLNGQFVFRKLPPVRRGPKAKPGFSIVFDGVDLGSDWRYLTGLEYLHTLIRHPGQPCHVRDLAPDHRAAYRFQQDAVERKPESEVRFRKGGRFTNVSPKRLKQLLETAKEKLALAEEKDEDEKERRDYEQQVEELTHEIERRDDPEMKKLMNTAQQHLTRAVDELKERMRENGISAADLEHFEHCKSSGDHPFHFSYRPAIQVDWETD